jgi:hypothetical protein
MSAITSALPLGIGAGERQPTRWIISRRQDLMWFIGSAAISYLALGLMGVGFPIALMTLIWLVGVDGPHVIATVTRTYFDKQERKRLGWYLWVIVPLIIVGPFMVWAGQGSLFFLFAVCWQHFHIAKQHFGFVMLWKAKNKERDPLDLKLDRWFLLSSTILPLALFVVKTRLMNFAVAKIAAVAALALYTIFVGVYIARQVQKHKNHLPMNTPKLLLLGVLVPLQWMAFMDAASLGPDGILRAGIALGLFHSLQYHRLLWFHNKNRYSGADAWQQYGLAAFFVKDFGYYLFLAIGLYLVLAILPQAMFPALDWVKAAVWGIPFTHYMLDSKIWRVRGNKELAAALKLG